MLVEFPPIFVANTRIIYGYNFVELPSLLISISSIIHKSNYNYYYYNYKSNYNYFDNIVWIISYFIEKTYLRHERNSNYLTNLYFYILGQNVKFCASFTSEPEKRKSAFAFKVKNSFVLCLYNILACNLVQPSHGIKNYIFHQL